MCHKTEKSPFYICVIIMQAFNEHACSCMKHACFMHEISCMFHAWNIHDQVLIHACFRPNHALFLPVKRPKFVPVSGMFQACLPETCMFEQWRTLVPIRIPCMNNIFLHAWNVLKQAWDLHVSGAIFWVG